MTVVIDIIHPAHVNFFKGIIAKLIQNGSNVIVITINRGKLQHIVKEELNNIEVNVIGRHRGTKASIIFEANLLRFFQLIKFIMFKKIDVGISAGSFILGAVLKLRGIVNYQVCDDPERKVNVFLENITSKERYLPPIITPSKKEKIFQGLKEWAYLSPKYFKANEKVLEKYGLKEKKYFFIREISTGSLNYQSQLNNIVLDFAADLKNQYDVILSLEDKRNINLYPKHWKHVIEPEKDIHSLIYFSKIVISSGDSMAREGAMLGVPSIYCGVREMKVNKILIGKKMLYKISSSEVIGFVNEILNGKLNLPEQNIFREQLLKEWIDVNEFFTQIILTNKN